MTFTEASLEVAKEFLNSAVIIDDHIEWSNKAYLVAADVGEIKQPDEFEGGGQLEVADDGGAQNLTSPIYASEIIKSFCENGIVCSPYVWENGADAPKFPNSMDKADLIILDWRLESDAEKGDAVCAMLSERLEEDLKTSPNFRYITIYSSEPQNGIFDKLVGSLENNEAVYIKHEDEKIDVCLGTENDHKVVWQIAYLSKTIPQSELAQNVIKGFSSFVSGFFPNAVLAAVADIRKNTPAYLAQFHKDLDIPVLNHFTYLKSPEHTFHTVEVQFRDYIINQIVSRIAADLHYSKALQTNISTETIRKYLMESEAPVLTAPHIGNGQSKITDVNKIAQLLGERDLDKFYSEGELAFGFTAKKNKDKWHEKCKPVAIQNASSKPIHDYELYERDLFLRTQYHGNRSYALKSGTILCRHNSDVDRDYFVCIQPLCDGVRLDPAMECHQFPVLKLEPVLPQKNYTFVFKHQNDYGHYKVEVKPRNIEMFKFKSKAGTWDVRFDENFMLNSYDSAEGKYEWVGELEAVYTQDILNQFGGGASRVGSDKHEKLRQKSG